MLHIALIVGVAYLAVAVLGYLVIFPILRAGREADRSMAEELELSAVAEEVEAPVEAPAAAAPRSARLRSGRFARRARRPLAARRPGA